MDSSANPGNAEQPPQPPPTIDFQFLNPASLQNDTFQQPTPPTIDPQFLSPASFQNDTFQQPTPPIYPQTATINSSWNAGNDAPQQQPEPQLPMPAYHPDPSLRALPYVDFRPLLPNLLSTAGYNPSAMNNATVAGNVPQLPTPPINGHNSTSRFSGTMPAQSTPCIRCGHIVCKGPLLCTNKCQYCKDFVHLGRECPQNHAARQRFQHYCEIGNDRAGKQITAHVANSVWLTPLWSSITGKLRWYDEQLEQAKRIIRQLQAQINQSNLQ